MYSNELRGHNGVREPSRLCLRGDMAGPRRKQGMGRRRAWGQRPREVSVPRQGPEERGHVYLLHEGERVTDPMLPVSAALFSPNTGQPPRTATWENLSFPTSSGLPLQGDLGPLQAVPVDCSWWPAQSPFLQRSRRWSVFPTPPSPVESKKELRRHSSLTFP